MKNKNHILSFVFIFILGISIGHYFKKETIIKPSVLRQEGFDYIKPVLLCNTNNNRSDNEDLSLEKSLEDYLKSTKNNISVYFLNLGNGEWAGVNDSMTFSPASMLKIPVTVDALKYSETHPEILSRKFYFDGSFDNNQAEYFKPEKSIEPGKYYSLNELIKYTISYSDNNALVLLHNNINSGSLEELYKNLKIDIPQNTLDFMSAKTYSLFLRVLYNSTYLKAESSEEIIKLMIGSSFPIGLSSGVGEETKVADKFGERVILDTNGNVTKRELHDCGIIYYPNNPYILCVMTSGQDFNKLAQNISDISRITYNHIAQ